jgi:hypothetical protein
MPNSIPPPLMYRFLEVLGVVGEPGCEPVGLSSVKPHKKARNEKTHKTTERGKQM